MPFSIDLKGSTAAPHQHFHNTGNTTMVDTTAFPSMGATTIADTSTTVTDGTVMADVTTIATAGTGSSVGNAAPAIPHSIVAQGEGL